jgi:hypothetical protein
VPKLCAFHSVLNLVRAASFYAPVRRGHEVVKVDQRWLGDLDAHRRSSSYSVSDQKAATGAFAGTRRRYDLPPLRRLTSLSLKAWTYCAPRPAFYTPMAGDM